MPKFKIGDFVKLKSGGPEMLVDELVWNPLNNTYKEIVICVWSKGDDILKETFNTENLMLSPMDSK